MDALTNPIDDSLMIQTETGKVQNMDLVNKKKTHHYSSSVLDATGIL